MGTISAWSKVTYNWLGQISQHIPQISCCMNTNQNNNKQTNKFNADSWSNHYSCKHQPSPPVERKCSVKTNKKFSYIIHMVEGFLSSAFIFKANPSEVSKLWTQAQCNYIPICNTDLWLTGRLHVSGLRPRQTLLR